MDYVYLQSTEYDPHYSSTYTNVYRIFIFSYCILLFVSPPKQSNFWKFQKFISPVNVIILLDSTDPTDTNHISRVCTTKVCVHS